MLKRNNVLLGIAIICAFLCSFSTFVGFRAIVAGCMLLLALLGKDVILLYPLVLFFYTQFGLFAGFSISRLFSLCYLLNLFCMNRGNAKIRIRRSNLLLLIIYTAYVGIVLFGENISLAISSLINIITIALMVSTSLTNEEQLSRFFRIFSIVALLSIPAGMYQGNRMLNLQVIDGVLIETSRFMGTFEDPNYFTFFFYIAIISLLTLKPFSKWIRYLLICIFQVSIFSTLSITGIVCGLIIWWLYLAINHRINMKLFLIIPCVIVGAIYLYNYGLQNQDAPIIGDLAMRLYDKILGLQIGDVSKITTGRTSLTQGHLEYFFNQNIVKMLFGGNLANTRIMRLGSIRYAAHNEYVDMLLNIGVIGSVAFFCGYFNNIWMAYRQKRVDKANENISNCIILMKGLWLLYAGTLTMFLEERFMMFVFL